MSPRLVTAFGVLLLAGCGGDDNDKKPAVKRVAVPPQLQGTYTVHLKPGDLPAPKSAPPELKPGNKPYAWRVEITDTGGPDNGPTLNIVNVTMGSLEAPKLSVTGERLRLSQEECAGDQFVNTTYRWARNGNTLRLTKLGGGCPDKVAETILTARPLTKVP